jgi:hypothetical protein
MTKEERTKFLNDIERDKKKNKLSKIIDSHQNENHLKDLQNELQSIKPKKKGG